MKLVDMYAFFTCLPAQYKQAIGKFKEDNPQALNIDIVRTLTQAQVEVPDVQMIGKTKLQVTWVVACAIFYQVTEEVAEEMKKKMNTPMAAPGWGAGNAKP